MIVEIYLDAKTAARLKLIAEERGSGVDDLCEAAVEEAALDVFRNRADDPARLVS